MSLALLTVAVGKFQVMMSWLGVGALISERLVTVWRGTSRDTPLTVAGPPELDYEMFL